MENKSSNKEANTNTLDGLLKKGGVGTMLFIHDEKCSHLKGGSCQCSPEMKILTGDEYLAFLKESNK